MIKIKIMSGEYEKKAGYKEGEIVTLKDEDFDGLILKNGNLYRYGEKDFAFVHEELNLTATQALDALKRAIG